MENRLEKLFCKPERNNITILLSKILKSFIIPSKEKCCTQSVVWGPLRVEVTSRKFENLNLKGFMLIKRPCLYFGAGGEGKALHFITALIVSSKVVLDS